MSHPRRAFFTALVAAAAVVTAGAKEPRSAKKKVLVELYTSQGCDMCPKAEQLLGALKGLGYGPDRAVPVAFHVDYFNTPWKDPFSDNLFSRRQYEYSLIHQREHKTDDPNYLYFTPMLMVDGRHPMLGSDRPKAQAALRKALAERPGASIDADLKPDPKNPRAATLSVSVRSLASTSAKRPLLVGVALWEDPVTTRVGSGENAGKTLVEHYAVRKFVYERITLAESGAKSLSFPLALGGDWNPSHCGVAVFVQNWDDGRVHQAEALPWEGSAPDVAKRK